VTPVTAGAATQALLAWRRRTRPQRLILPPSGQLQWRFRGLFLMILAVLALSVLTMVVGSWTTAAILLVTAGVVFAVSADSWLKLQREGVLMFDDKGVQIYDGPFIPFDGIISAEIERGRLILSFERDPFRAEMLRQWAHDMGAGRTAEGQAPRRLTPRAAPDQMIRAAAERNPFVERAALVLSYVPVAGETLLGAIQAERVQARSRLLAHLQHA